MRELVRVNREKSAGVLRRDQFFPGAVPKKLTRRFSFSFLLFFHVFLAFLFSCQSENSFFPRNSENSVLRISFLNVGQGDATLLQLDGHSFLLDAGPDSAGILDTLKNRGITQLDWVLITHLDRDHFGGLLEILAKQETDGFPMVKRIILGPDKRESWYGDSLLLEIKLQQILVETVYRGDTLDGLLPFRARVIWPGSLLEEFQEGNVASLVIKIYDEEDQVLLMGDADSVVEYELLRLEGGLNGNLDAGYKSSLNSSVYKVGHHGSGSSTSLPFLDQVRPVWAVISVGADNGYGHPTDGVMADLYHVLPDSSCLLRTDLDGTIGVEWVYGLGFVF